MAKGTARSLSGTMIGLVAFITLWLVSTVLLIILYTGQQDLVEDNNRLRAAKERLASSQEENSLPAVKSARPQSEGGPTVVGLLERSRGETAELATGDKADDAAAVRKKRDDLARGLLDDKLVEDADSYQDASLLDALTRLYSSHRTLHDKWRKAESGLVEIDAEVAKLREAANSFKADCDERMRELGEQLAKVEADRATYRKERDDAVTALEREFDQGRAENTALLTRERQELLKCSERLTEAQDRYNALREKVGGMMAGPEELSSVRRADGKVLTAVPGDDVVYVNLGRRDRLSLGLQFAVYSAETGIPADGRSKAQIEVVSISDATCECRILHVERGAVILEGDLVANPVYDPTRPMVFAIIGEFDMDRDGGPDRGGAATVEAIIRNWGGTVEPQIGPLTDFVVVGSAPARPRADADVSPDQAEAHRLRKQAWEAYMGAIETARSLSVPLMNQDVFLAFLGKRDGLTRR